MNVTEPLKPFLGRKKRPGRGARGDESNEDWPNPETMVKPTKRAKKVVVDKPLPAPSMVRAQSANMVVTINIEQQ